MTWIVSVSVIDKGVSKGENAGLPSQVMERLDRVDEVLPCGSLLITLRDTVGLIIVKTYYL